MSNSTISVASAKLYIKEYLELPLAALHKEGENILHTTFALVRKAGACDLPNQVLAKALGGLRKYGAHTSIPLTRILELQGFDATLWCLRCVLPGEEAARDRLARLLVCVYAEHVAYLWVPPAGVTWRPEDAISVARRYALGQATDEELGKARKSAESAAWVREAGQSDAVTAAALAGEAAQNTTWAGKEDIVLFTARVAVSARARVGVAEVAAEFGLEVDSLSWYRYECKLKAGAVEREWQTEQLRRMLDGTEPTSVIS